MRYHSCICGRGHVARYDHPHFRQKVKEFAAGLPEVEGFSNDPNEVINWLKHGNYKKERRETLAIENSEPPVIIWRAITKFYATFNEVSPQMQSWQTSMRERLIADGVKPKSL
ncbi:hypothetical protein [Bradyrhizobium sp. SSUT77]|uniref:hypothetical protein n=1 Tax=Bradyrhizobium sp. SSUT77 TaxID=3040603 RepID=UPI0024475E90|nr:hypothetical protein [Bradyrhizobium sp. SSUT77]MDH2343366.1 hypothetical protein [Bradyrhizobium sp. SSUT77]